MGCFALDALDAGSFVPHVGWRFVVLDAFAISTLGYPPDHPRNRAAWEMLDAHNPNDCTRQDIDLSQGMTGVDSRWMPYNGAHGEEQLAWLETTLGEAKAAGERVVVLTHVGVCPGVCDDDTLAWDYDKVLALLHGPAGKGVVAAVLSGHDHKGGYVRDGEGIHHLTFKAPLETPPPAGCHAIVEVSDRALLVRGYGRQESRLLLL
jgi:manganese-dependent ADP-ribose/CDP-alcohol diphosphatase